MFKNISFKIIFGFTILSALGGLGVAGIYLLTQYNVYLGLVAYIISGIIIYKLQGVINMNNFMKWFDSLTQLATLAVSVYFITNGKIDLAIYYILFAILLK